MKHFVLIGAGFSRAFSQTMPLLSDLSEAVLRDLNLPSETLLPFSDNLEQWLSHLSTDQPWLTESENLRNRARFRDATQAVKRCIDAAEEAAVVQPPPSWAVRLVNQWCDESASIASFNYDLIVERLASRSDRVRTWADLYGMSLAERLPPGTHLMFATTPPNGPTCRLYKMHGSVNWFYGGQDAPSTDRVILQSQGAHWPWDGGSVIPGDHTGRTESLFDDLQPLIVPPTGLKAPYYSNASLRAQWRRAFAALSSADRVTIIGYSFPPSDLVSRHFVSTANLTCPVAVVDRSGTAATQVRQLAPKADVEAITGSHSIEDYCNRTCSDFVEWSAWRREDQYIPRLWVNGVEESSLQLTTRAEMAKWNEAAVAEILHEEIDRRWPGLRAAQPAGRRIQHSSNGSQVLDGYVSRA